MKTTATVPVRPNPSATVIVTFVPCGLSFADGVTVNVPIEDGVTVASVVSLETAVKLPEKPLSLAVKFCGAFKLGQPVVSFGS